MSKSSYICIHARPLDDAYFPFGQKKRQIHYIIVFNRRKIEKMNGERFFLIFVIWSNFLEEIRGEQIFS